MQGAPPKKKKITLSLSPLAHHLLNELSRRYGVSRTGIIELALREKYQVDIGPIDFDPPTNSKTN